MRAGLLRKRVTIAQESRTSDDRGGHALAWTTVVTVWGEVGDLSARERLAAQQLESDIATAITIRYRAGVTAAMRATVDSVNYQIRGVRDPDGRKKMLILDCERGVAI